MHPTVLDIARAARARRKSTFTSQRELGRRAGLTQAQISRFESGQVDLRLSSLVELARGLGLEVMLVPRGGVPAAVEMGAQPGTGDDAQAGGEPDAGDEAGGGVDRGPADG